MLTLAIPREISQRLEDALSRAGRREVGGILMAEHAGVNQFVVREITVHRAGAVAAFVRRVEEALGRLKVFFDETNHDYSHYNYVGEWHSHPSFIPEPSSRDDRSMRQIVEDASVGANFAVLLIVRLADRAGMEATVHTYLPNGCKYRSTLVFL
jgi:integrative and conjugative element protein (TIGR02256 family)